MRLDGFGKTKRHGGRILDQKVVAELANVYLGARGVELSLYVGFSHGWIFAH